MSVGRRAHGQHHGPGEDLFVDDVAEAEDEQHRQRKEGEVHESLSAGCPLSGIKEKLIACDCHGSRFDPVKNGEVAHGPAVRKLPQLGLAVKDGKIVVAAAFDSKIGGDMMGEDDR